MQIIQEMLKNLKYYIYDCDHKKMTPLHIAIIKGNLPLAE